MAEEKKGFFKRLVSGLTKTRDNIVKGFDSLFSGYSSIDDDFYEELEEILITSDIGMETTMKIVDMLRTEVKTNNLTKPSVIKIRLAKIISSVINKKEEQKLCQDTPLVILMIGINGGGKTTSIGKLAHKLRQEGKTVMLAAADTFRAAAAEQLCIWGDRVGVNVVKHKEGADPSAVIYDAIQSAKAKHIDVLICDTAGRLQNKKNLMDELNKMNKVIGREYPEAARENLLVLDATTGKNAVSQVQEFGDVADITGIILTKLDGTAKGGIVVTIADEFDMPVKFIGVGEGIEDLKEFDPVEFAEGIFNE